MVVHHTEIHFNFRQASGECQVDMRAFLSISQEDESCCEISKRSFLNFMENKKLTLEPRIICLRDTGFGEISTRQGEEKMLREI